MSTSPSLTPSLEARLPAALFARALGIAVWVGVSACSRIQAAPPDQVPLARWPNPPGSVDAAVAHSRTYAEAYACDDVLGGSVSTCGAFTRVSWSGGYSGESYYFGPAGLIGVDTQSDVPTPPTKFGEIPTCAPWIAKRRLCKGASDASPQ